MRMHRWSYGRPDVRTGADSTGLGATAHNNLLDMSSQVGPSAVCPSVLPSVGPSVSGSCFRQKQGKINISDDISVKGGYIHPHIFKRGSVRPLVSQSVGLSMKIYIFNESMLGETTPSIQSG